MHDPATRFQFIADRGDSRLRLDQVLVRRVTVVTHMSRNVAQRWIEAGVVTIDGRQARRPSDRVREHATIEVALPPDATLRSVPEPEEATLDILYEDEHLVAVNKPAGVVVHPTYKRLTGTLLNAILWHVRDRGDVRPGILTRLDKDTSGLVVVAFADGVHAAMQRDGAAGHITKEYLAIVHGTPHPASGVIREPLGRDPDDRRRVIVTPGGAASETRYEVTKSIGGTTIRPKPDSTGTAIRRKPDSPTSMSLVRCELVTGRTHQIRVHLSWRGWPIVGDSLYGGRNDVIARQALHAWRLSLPHPVTREHLVIEAPLPADWPSGF
jgi:23S rRNA pseudouridine1911/1915/1917 synthase